MSNVTVIPSNGTSNAESKKVSTEFGIDNCPVQDAIGAIADKWKLLILMELSRIGTQRFKELQRGLGSISQKVLTSALRDLEREGLVSRHVFAEVPPRVEYTITESAQTLLPILDQLQEWAVQRSRRP